MEEISKLGEYLNTLRSEDIEECKRAIRALKRLKSKVAVPALVNLVLYHKDKWVRVEAIEALKEINDPRILALAIKYLKHPRFKEIRPWLIWIIGKMGKKEHLSIIEPFLFDPDPRVKANTAEAMDDLGADRIVDKLLPFLEDTNHRLKSTIAKILWKYGGTRVIGILKQMYQEAEDKWQRAAAIFALGEIGGYHVIDIVLDALNDKTVEVLRNAIKALGKIGDITYSHKIIPFISHEDVSVRVNAIEALSKLKDKNAIKPLFDQLLKESDLYVKSSLRNAIINITKAFGEQLKGMVVLYIQSPSREVRKIAAEVLGIIGDITVVTFLKKLAFNDVDTHVREAANAAISKIQKRYSN